MTTTIDHLQELIRIHRLNLDVLLRQRGTFGAMCPPHITTQIAAARAEVQRLRAACAERGHAVSASPLDADQAEHGRADTGEQTRAFLLEVAREVERARALHAPINSAHEGYAVILEELDEFKVEVWKKRSARDPAAMLAELVQIAAMAARVAADIGLMGGAEGA